ncbi:malate dehydrogenase [Photobacterium gaetbulicola]|uniref:Malate dehydrogenase n=1 Tax=Photobacterium gaetbulicola TaxID=1295392 RepID=A0A0B9FZD9_9GAMM|nr:NAD(P)-binding domain-containing protein [Photobacterium gaetbulicola]KHT61589.1 malate dehydrogenase [Photobacterium gaetbulicola]
MKIGIIGAGSVGVGVCNYLLTLGSVSELVLLDKNLERATGEILDFSHTEALTFSKNTTLTASDNYDALTDAEIVVITAGAQIKEGQSRLDLAEINSQIGVDIARQIEKVAPNAVLIIVTNPCDIVAYFIVANTGFNASQVLSAGCLVDTARLMTIIGKRVKLDPKNVFGYVLGEHGSHCFTPKSLISIAGQPADYYCDTNRLPPIEPAELLEAVKQAGFEIFKRKQNTAHGIAASVFRIIQAISINEHSVLPIGTMVRGEYGLYDVVLSLPTVVNAKGAESILIHPFTDAELNELEQIAHSLKQCIHDVRVKTGLIG